MAFGWHNRKDLGDAGKDNRPQCGRLGVRKAYS
jgi:hypothetical protein